jgi:transcription elongation factor GreA
MSANEREALQGESITADGLRELKAEVEELEGPKRKEIAERIKTARELGDLKENADYHAAREEQSFLEGRIQTIEAVLRGAEVVAAPSVGAGIGLGSTVTVEADGEEVTYQLVSSSEAHPGSGRISVASPVGKALLGHAAGDEVVVRTPQGEARYRVISIG